MPSKSYEDEIRELLNRMDRFLPEERRRRRAGVRLGTWWRTVTSGIQLQPLTPHRLMAASIVLMLFSWVLTLFLPRVAAMVSLVSVTLFVVALVMAIRARASPGFGDHGGRYYWRDRVIELPQRNWSWRLRRWWQGRR